MAEQVFPTKGNLINIKKSLALAKMGYELMDRKRNILIREIMQMIDSANSIKDVIDQTYAQAYFSLQRANITLGLCESIAQSTPIETGVSVTYRSVMGVEIPTVMLKESPVSLTYGFWGSNSQFDEAYICFSKVKTYTARLAEVENSIYRLAVAIKKTQKRANALKNIILPRFEEQVRYISNALEEKEREEFSRLKVIKAGKEKAKAKARK